jgi:hypothetical protein
VGVAAAASLMTAAVCLLSLLFFGAHVQEIHAGQHCADFTTLSAQLQAANGGSKDEGFHFCPDDGISNSDMCTTPINMKAAADIKYASLPWEDIVVYILVQSKSVQTHSLLHWLGTIPENQVLNLAFVADYCDSPCSDHVSGFADKIQAEFGKKLQLKLKVIRTLQGSDQGPARVACKALTGMRNLYAEFPASKYYVKLNEDTILFPSRLQQFLSTLDAVAYAEKDPLYFGSILHLYRGIPLCDNMGLDEAGNPTYPNKKGQMAGDPVCNSQGEAYGFNNVAMKFFSNVSLCTHQMDLEAMQEDIYFGWKLFKDLRAVPIHCGAFRPHGLSETIKYTREHHDAIDLSAEHSISIGEYHKRIY